MAGKPYIIALEEHYHAPEVVEAMKGQMEGRRNDFLRAKLDDLGAIRLKDMDEAGIDYQVLSHGAPSTQRVSGDDAIRIARIVNDNLHQVVRAHPTRFGAFGAIPS